MNSVLVEGVLDVITDRSAVFAYIDHDVRLDFDRAP